MAVGHRAGPARLEAETDKLLDGMAGRFARVETRRPVRRFVLGLLSNLPRKNCWSIAEHAGWLSARHCAERAASRGHRQPGPMAWWLG
ncbi:MAG: hypothetical protein ACJ72I_23150 [Pseudonocardiaceae bacterium]